MEKNRGAVKGTARRTRHTRFLSQSATTLWGSLSNVAQAKGSNLHHLREFVRKRFDDGAWKRLIAQLSEPEQDTWRAVVPVGWYPLLLQLNTLAALERVLGHGDGALIEELGAFEAKQDLTVIHRLFLRMANPAYLLEKSAEYWNRFYDEGTWEVTRVSAQEARGLLRGVQLMNDDFGRYLSAYIRAMWKLMGAELEHSAYEIIQELGAPVLVVEGRWR